MFALSRDGEKFFLHQPDAGMVVPVLLDFKNGRLAVQVPSVDELEHDYAVYDELSEVVSVVGGHDRDQVTFARKFSQECSRMLREELSTRTLTVSQLRKLVEDHLRHAIERQHGASVSRATVAQADPEPHAAMVAAFARSFSAD